MNFPLTSKESTVHCFPFFEEPPLLNFITSKISSKNIKSKSIYALSNFSDKKLPLAPFTHSKSLHRKNLNLKLRFHDIGSSESQNNRVRIFNQESSFQQSNKKNTSNIIISLHRKSARNTQSLTSKQLFRSNLSKFFAGKFSSYEEKQPTVQWNNEKDLKKDIPMNFDQDKVKSYIMSFSKKYPLMIKPSSVNQTCLEQFKTITKLDFQEKEKENSKLAQTKQRNLHKRALSHYSPPIISPMDRSKFSKIINKNGITPLKKLNIFEYDQDFRGSSDDFFNPREEFEEMSQEEEIKVKKKGQAFGKIELYNNLLKKIEKGEKKKEMNFFNSTYQKNYKKNLLKERMLVCLLKLSKMKLNINELAKIAYKPYQREGSFFFLEAVRLGEMMKVEELLKKNRLLIYDFDQFHQTALHIACKKCNFQIVKVCIENGAEINSIDSSLKTPLFIAINNNFLNGIRFLLYSGANPWSSKECAYEKAIKSKMTRFYLKKAKEISIILKFVKNENENKKIWLAQRRVFAKILS